MILAPLVQIFYLKLFCQGPWSFTEDQLNFNLPKQVFFLVSGWLTLWKNAKSWGCFRNDPHRCVANWAMPLASKLQFEQRSLVVSCNLSNDLRYSQINYEATCWERATQDGFFPLRSDCLPCLILCGSFPAYSKLSLSAAILQRSPKASGEISSPEN